MFVAAEPIEKDVFAIFPTVSFIFLTSVIWRASVNQSLLDLRPSESKYPSHANRPDNPARASHPENVIREMLPAAAHISARQRESSSLAVVGCRNKGAPIHN